MRRRNRFTRIGSALTVAALSGLFALPLWGTGVGTWTALKAADCSEGPVRFTEAFAKYFDAVGELYVGKDEAWIRKTMQGEDTSRYEIDLLATPALPENYAFLVRRMGCWMQVYDSIQAMQRGSHAEADGYMEDWRSCIEAFYDGKIPALAQEILDCHKTARRNLTITPAQVKP